MTQLLSPQPKKSLYWFILFAAVVVGVGGWYLLTKDDKGSEGNGNTNNLANADTPNTQFVDPVSGYTIQYPLGWARKGDVTGYVNSFTHDGATQADVCRLSISLQGITGRELDLKKGQSESIILFGKPATKNIWVDANGKISFFNVETDYKGVTLGIEGTIGNDVSLCSDVLNDMVSSLQATTSGSGLVTYTEDSNKYVLRMPMDWVASHDVGDDVMSFTPKSQPNGNACYIKISTKGILGHGGITYAKGQDAQVAVDGISTTKHTWVNSTGRVMYYNFEVVQDPLKLGFEVSTGSNDNYCSQRIEEMIKTLKINGA